MRLGVSRWMGCLLIFGNTSFGCSQKTSGRDDQIESVADESDQKVDQARKKARKEREDADKEAEAQEERKRREEAEKRKVLDQLAGLWMADGSRRQLRAFVVGETVEFRIEDGAEWGDTYLSGEVRVVLTPTGDSVGEHFSLVDHVRVASPGRTKYAAAALASCTLFVENVRGENLGATLRGKGDLELKLSAFDIERSQFVCAGSASGVCDTASTEVTWCRLGVFKLATGRTTTGRLRKVR